jgi:hypothetical protein
MKTRQSLIDLSLALVLGFLLATALFQAPGTGSAAPHAPVPAVRADLGDAPPACPRGESPRCPYSGSSAAAAPEAVSMKDRV